MTKICQMRRYIFLCFAMGLSLSGCVTTDAGAPGSAVASDLPPNYRQMIAEKIKTLRHGSILEPGTGSITNARISQPLTKFAGITGGGTVPTVCVAWDMNSSQGGTYRGQFIFAFSGGTFSRAGAIAGAAFQEILCGADRVFQPFPEANTTG